MNDAERAAYEAWREARTPYRDGSSMMNAFLAGFRAALPITPTWDALSVPDKLDHIEGCWGCSLCHEGRAWGTCSSCGDVKEALPPEGLSRCCGSVVVLEPAELDNLAAVSDA